MTQDPQQVVTVPRELLERAKHFVSHVRTFDWKEDRCVMTAVHLAGDIGKALSASPPAPEDMRERRREIARIIDPTSFGGGVNYSPDKARRALAKAGRILAALSPVAVAGRGEPVSSADFHQRRGRLPDLIEEAIGIFDDWMQDDDYNTRGCLDEVIDKLKSARDWYDTPKAQPLAPTGEASGAAWLRDMFDRSGPCPTCGTMRIGGDDADSAASATTGDEALRALDWFASDQRLELSHYSPTYGDDDDQSYEWRVHRVEGSINDREWILIGRGATPLAAIQAALAAAEERLTSGGATSARGQASPGSPRG